VATVKALVEGMDKMMSPTQDYQKFDLNQWLVNATKTLRYVNNVTKLFATPEAHFALLMPEVHNSYHFTQLMYNSTYSNAEKGVAGRDQRTQEFSESLVQEGNKHYDRYSLENE
jgi:hypothetical protein